MSAPLKAIAVALASLAFALSACGNGFALTGNVEGLAGTGLVLFDGRHTLAVNDNGPFKFGTSLAQGTAYQVTLAQEPTGPRQTCAVQNGSGTIGNSAPDPVSVQCVTQRFLVGGLVSGMRGNGLVLINNGGEALNISANGPFTFATPLDDLSPLNVTVGQQPSAPTQKCVVEIAGNVRLEGQNSDAVQVRCGFEVSGVIENIAGPGLVLTMNGTQRVMPVSEGPFSFPLPLDDGDAYQVVLTAQPAAPVEACELQGGSGTVMGQPVNRIRVTCRATGGLRITEIGGCHANTASCWLEVHNPSSQVEQLSLYRLRSTAAKRIAPFTIENAHLFVLPRHSLAPGEYVLLRGKATDGHFDGPRVLHLVEGDVTPWWNSDGFAELVTGGHTADFVRWGSNSETPLTAGQWLGPSSPSLPAADAAYGSVLVRDLPYTDTQSATDWRLGNFSTPGGPNDITSNVDADGDGVPDQAEVQGSTYAGLDMYALGARVAQPDIFVEVHRVDSDDPGVIPQPAALAKVTAAFQGRGYAVHFDVAENPLAAAQCTMLGPQDDCTDLYAFKATAMDVRRYPLFHFMLFAYSQLSSGGTGASGRAESLGNDALITLGNWGLKTDTVAATNMLVNFQAATVMHELGHNLGLRHGGGDDINDKPNYVSVMNYTYGIFGLPTFGASEGDRFYFFQSQRGNRCGGVEDLAHLQNSPVQDPATFRIDFSDGTGTLINESSIDEAKGLGRNSGVAVDFNCNGQTDGPYQRDINLDTFPGPLADHNDWGAVVLPFRRTPHGDDQGQPSHTRRPFDVMTQDAQRVAFEPLPSPALLRAIKRAHSR